MDVLRTPDEHFEGLPDFPFEPNYVDIETDDGTALRVHYVDEGPADGPVVLLMHGEPSWSYLYRKMIPILVDAGYRTIAPDLPGFGRSDKPADRSDYTYARFVSWMRQMLDAADLTGIRLVCQDWGGLIGLRLVAAELDRFDAVVVANSFLPTGDAELPDAFFKWREISQSMDDIDVGMVLEMGTITDLPDEVLAAYRAPFPDASYKAGAHIFPMLVPATPDDPESAANRAAWASLSKFDKPFLTAFGTMDPIMAGADSILQSAIPGAEGQPHTTLEAGHFIQEDAGEELAQVCVDFFDGL